MEHKKPCPRTGIESPLCISRRLVAERPVRLYGLLARVRQHILGSRFDDHGEPWHDGIGVTGLPGLTVTLGQPVEEVTKVFAFLFGERFGVLPLREHERRA